MTPPLVMVHGAFCGGWVFDGYRRLAEARGHRCFAPDLRYHDRPGGAPPHTELGRLSLLDYADDLEALIRRLDAPPVLLGHSLGGLLCQMLAARGLASALVLLAPSPPWGVLPSTPFEVMAGISVALSGGIVDQPLRPAYEAAVACGLDHLPPVQRHAVFARLVPESGRAAFETLFWACDPRQASRVDPEAVRCPVLVVSGGEDRICPPQTMRRIARRYRGDHAPFDGFGHWLLGEPGWRRIALHCLDWLERQSAHARAPSAGIALF